MSTIRAAIYELFQKGRKPSEICKLLKPRVSRSGVNKVLKRLRETGSTLPKLRSTPIRRVRTPNLIKNLKRSIQKLALEANVSYGTIQTVLKIDLNLLRCKKSKKS